MTKNGPHTRMHSLFSWARGLSRPHAQDSFYVDVPVADVQLLAAALPQADVPLTTTLRISQVNPWDQLIIVYEAGGHLLHLPPELSNILLQV